MIKKIVSGGQTGVDRAALDVAMELGLPHGGFCPNGRKAEDGPIPSRYQLTETESADYGVRTRRNVDASDGTLIIKRGDLKAGTAYTAACAQELKRPLFIVDLDDPPNQKAFQNWLSRHTIHVLNVAGPRESQQSRIYALAHR